MLQKSSAFVQKKILTTDENSKRDQKISLLQSCNLKAYTKLLYESVSVYHEIFHDGDTNEEEFGKKVKLL